MSVDAISFENLVDFLWNGETAQNLLHPFVQASTDDANVARPIVGAWYSKKEPDYDMDEGNHEYNPYGKTEKDRNNNFEMADIIDELPEYNVDLFKEGDTDVFDYFKYYRWAINAAIIGFPWWATAFSCFAYNIYFNIAWNKWWASGNAYLLMSSVYLFYQVVNSIPLIFELPIWLRAFRVTRILSFFSAIVYTFVYFLSAFEWYDQIWLVTDKSTYDFVTIIINMLLGYNLILHSSIIPVNIAIIVKEISLNFFSVSGKGRHNESNKYLNTGDLKEAEKDINPLTYVDEAAGYDVMDTVIENKQDEKHYIGNWGKWWNN